MELRDSIRRKQIVMVVDDDADLRMLLAQILDFEGIGVLCAESGQEALNQLKYGVTPDLILTDMHMPGMDGFEFFSKLKHNLKTRNVPVILISGDQDLQEHAKIFGAKMVLRKPHNLDTLSDLLKENLH